MKTPQWVEYGGSDRHTKETDVRCLGTDGRLKEAINVLVLRLPTVASHC